MMQAATSRWVAAGLALHALCAAPAARAQSPGEIRAAVVRARPLIERSIATFTAKRSCVSCHHNGVAMLAVAALERHGLGVAPRVRAALEAKTLFELRRESAFDDAVQGSTFSDPTPNDTYLLMAAHAAGVPGDDALGIHARRIARWQRPEGHWTTSDFRPPHSSSVFTTTATAIRAIRLFMPETLAAERDATVSRATSWLAATAPLSTEDAAFRVMGLAWGGSVPSAIATAVADLRARQMAGGGWPQLPGYAADAYSTGEALVALRAAGVPATDPDIRRGVRFLIAAQAADGSWRTRSRMLSPATVSPPYFRTGYPYGRDEFLSFTGACWAVMALTAVLPEPPVAHPPAAKLASEARAPEWASLAAFGSVAELTRRLDAGLDPDSATTGGTTLLMLAAHDAAKLRVLLDRGAAATHRSASGVDALTVASTYFGSAESVRALLAAGAVPTAPEGVRVRRLPLVFAAMAGDLDVVQQLLAAGAVPSGEALAEAVTFNQPAVVRRLIEAGADVHGEDRTGINLLHWATITNRPDAVPLLVRAGLDVDSVDGRGYTPLMYAAAIDFGDRAVLDALLASGAARDLRNESGETAAQVARRLGHLAIARRLTR